MAIDQNKIDTFMIANAKYFESYQIPNIRERLMNLDESKWQSLTSMHFKDPTTSLIISLVGGHFGIDRFIIGDVGLGIGKLLTCGGFGIWTIVDWFMIMDATREKNSELVSRIY